MILDHPLDPSLAFNRESDTLVISLDDWLSLHEAIRSTAGVVDYVRCALTSGIVVALGHELRRYTELAAADARYASDSPTAVPFLSSVPLSTNEGVTVALFDELIEKVADSENLGWDSEQYLFIVEQLDRTPLLSRVSLGAKMLATFRAMIESRHRRSFVSVDRESGRRIAFLYEYHRPPDYGDDGESFIAQVAAYGALRHRHAIVAGAEPESPTLTVGVLHNPGRGRRYSFALFSGEPPELPRELREALEREYGVFAGLSVVAR